jgi:tripartite-type tricarboxylate transporter receptor subunit TctC
MKRFLTIVCFLILAVTFASPSHSADTAKAAAFYKGKNMDFIINDGPGSDGDILSRLLGPYLKDHTGATPIYANKRGAGGVEGYVHLFKAAPDGLSLGLGTSLPLILNKVTDAPGAIYEPDKFGYVGSFLQVGNVFIVAANSPYKTVADLKKAKKLVLGATSPQGNLALATMSVIKILDLDAKVITGTKGAQGLLQDILSGEVTGSCLPMQVALRGIRDGNYKALFTLANKRFAEIPDVPSLKEVASEIEKDAEKKELISIWDQNMVMTHAIITPPGVDKEKIEFLQELMPKLKKSPQFRQDLDKVAAFHVEDTDILSGPEAEKIVRDAMSKAGRMKAIFLQLIKQYKL